jgi:hypothetical protein
MEIYGGEFKEGDYAGTMAKKVKQTFNSMASPWETVSKTVTLVRHRWIASSTALWAQFQSF